MPDPASSFLKGGLSILSMPALNQQHTKQVTNCDSQSFSVISEFTQTPFVKDYSPSFMLFGVFVQPCSSWQKHPIHIPTSVPNKTSHSFQRLTTPGLAGNSPFDSSERTIGELRTIARVLHNS